MADHLRSKGYTVYGTSRKSNLTNPPSGVSFLKMDVNDYASVRAAVNQLVSETGRIDILINNAGIGSIGPLEESPMEVVESVMNTNLYGVLRVCQAVLPIMRQQGDGLIINISSIGGVMGLPFRGAYSASKFALEGLTESLSLEVKPFGISVCMVEPGDFNTEISQNRLVTGLDDRSVYRDTCRRLQETVDRQMERAPNPEAMGPLIHHIIERKNRKLRYKLGSVTEKLSVSLKTLLPGRWFEKIVSGFYKL